MNDDTIYYLDNGHIVSGVSLEEAKEMGMTKLPPRPLNPDLTEWDGTQWVAPVDTRDWEQRRMDDYGSIESQLDMLYWDKVNGTQNWQNHITAVKQKHPKDISDDRNR